MPIYPFKCLHVAEDCGRDFEIHVPIGIYDQHRAVAFRDVPCPHCNQRGAVRTWNPGDGPHVHTMYGQFERHHHPDLVGKTFSSREEYNRMLRAVGEDPTSTNTVSVAETGRSRQQGEAKSSESKKVDVAHEAAKRELAEKKARKATLLAVISEADLERLLAEGKLLKHGGGWISAA